MVHMKTLYFYIQSLLLLCGTLFSWLALTQQFKVFYAAHGTLFQFTNCIVPNPLVTPCFYGALAFAVAFIWSLYNLCHPDKKHCQRWLRNFLLFGVVFAFSVLTYEALEYYHFFTPENSISCAPGVHPLKTPCFQGALFFLTAWTASVAAYRIQKLH